MGENVVQIAVYSRKPKCTGKGESFGNQIELWSAPCSAKTAWSVAPNPYGITVSASGVLSTKKVYEPVTVNIMVTTTDGSGKLLSFDVTVYPV